MCNLSEALVEQGIEQGIEQGRKIAIFESVMEGDYDISRGAEKCGVSVEAFLDEMEAAGFSIPVKR